MNRYTPQYCAELAAGRLKYGCTTVFLDRPKRVKGADGSVRRIRERSIYGSDGKWHVLDLAAFFAKLGAAFDSECDAFASLLGRLGYKVVHAEGWLLVVT